MTRQKQKACVLTIGLCTALHHQQQKSDFNTMTGPESIRGRGFWSSSHWLPAETSPPPPSHQSTQNFPLCLMVPVGPSKISPVKQLFGHNFSAAGPSLPWRMLGSYDRLRESRRWSLSLYSGRDHTGLGSSHLARWQWSLHWEACHRCHMLLCSHQFWLIQYQLGGRAQVFTSCSFVN